MGKRRRRIKKPTIGLAVILAKECGVIWLAMHLDFLFWLTYQCRIACANVANRAFCTTLHELVINISGSYSDICYLHLGWLVLSMYQPTDHDNALQWWRDIVATRARAIIHFDRHVALYLVPFPLYSTLRVIRQTYYTITPFCIPSTSTCATRWKQMTNTTTLADMIPALSMKWLHHTIKRYIIGRLHWYNCSGNGL